MTVQVDMLGLVITLVSVILAVVLVPMVLRVRSAAQQLEDFLKETQRDLLPMLRDLREASERINRASAKAEEGMEQAGSLMESLGEVGDSVHRVNDFLRHDVGRYGGNALGLWLGIRAASKVFLKQLQKQHQGGD